MKSELWYIWYRSDSEPGVTNYYKDIFISLNTYKIRLEERNQKLKEENEALLEAKQRILAKYNETLR